MRSKGPGSSLVGEIAMTRCSLATTLTFLAFLSGCPAADDDDGGASASATDPSPSTGAEPGSESGESMTTSGSTTSSEPTTTSEPDTTTGGAPQSCEDATTQEECTAITAEYFTCAWYETTSVADPAACEGVASTGACLLSEQADGCTGSESGCTGSANTVLVRALAAGGYELVLDGPYCLDGIGDFQPCDEALAMEPGGLGPACACACTLLP